MCLFPLEFRRSNRSSQNLLRRRGTWGNQILLCQRRLPQQRRQQRIHPRKNPSPSAPRLRARPMRSGHLCNRRKTHWLDQSRPCHRGQTRYLRPLRTRRNPGPRRWEVAISEQRQVARPKPRCNWCRRVPASTRRSELPRLRRHRAQRTMLKKRQESQVRRAIGQRLKVRPRHP